jgi:predicted secreted hydrolase
MRRYGLVGALLIALVACGRDASHAVAERGAATSGTASVRTDDAPAPASRLEALRAQTLPPGFALVGEPITFEFPRDHGPHPAFRHEWWYVTGHLDARTGEHFGFELTFFRFALAPPAAPTSSTGDTAPTSAWRTRQIYMAHFAVTDLDRSEFHATERFARDALQMAGAQASPFRVWLDDWSLGTPPGESGPAGSSYWQLSAADAHYALDLQLRAITPPVLNGEGGVSRKSDEPGAASYYYSMPRLAVLGRVQRDGQPFEVDGLAWLDREWGSGGLGPNQQGWDWFALQLNDGGTLMFYALRTRDGRPDPHSAGTWFAPDGTTHALANDDVQIDTRDFWQSPRGGRYPARWQLRVPSLSLEVEITPRLADQELNTSTRYWEGAATITGTRANQRIAGRAYVELVGYAK